jgi:hypothetical protein
MANQARAGSARALLPVGAWGSTGGLSVGLYDGLSGLYDGLNLGPYSGPYTGLYVDVNRFTSLDIPSDWALPILPSRHSRRQRARRAVFRRR